MILGKSPRNTQTKREKQKEAIITFLRKFNLHPHHYVDNYEQILNDKLNFYSENILNDTFKGVYDDATPVQLLKVIWDNPDKIRRVLSEDDYEMIISIADDLTGEQEAYFINNNGGKRRRTKTQKPRKPRKTRRNKKYYKYLS